LIAFREWGQQPMLVIEPEVGNSALRLWVASGSAALLVFACALAIEWTRTRASVAVVLLAAVLGATLTWAFLGPSLRDQGAERRVLEMRAAQLDTQALAPGSPLACLDGMAADTVEAACERAIFTSPAAVASAISYVAARLALLADVVTYDRMNGRTTDDLLRPLRQSLEADRFGFVAHVLAVRDGCTSDRCAALTLLPDAALVRTNLSAQTLDRYLDHYASAWAQQPDVPVADAAAPSSAGTPPAAGLTGQKKVLIDADFPSAASIPPVSIMNPEPKGSPAGVAAGASRGAAPPSPPRQIRKQAATSPGPTLASPGPPAAAPVDPVWTPGTTPIAPQPPSSPPPPQTSAGEAPPAQ
jgi:hypothetical protein